MVGRPGIRLWDANSSLRVMTRRLKDAEVYVLFNEGPQSLAEKALLHADGRRVQQWDARTGKVEQITLQRAKRGVTVNLELKPYEMRLLVVRSTAYLQHEGGGVWIEGSIGRLSTARSLPAR